MNDNELWDMSDDELEAAYKEALVQESSPDTDLENEQDTFVEPETSDEDPGEEVDLDEVDETDLNDGPDQPENDEESGHDTSDELDTDEVTDEDASEAGDEELDEDPDAEKEELTDETDEVESKEQPVQNYKFKANGKDYEFSSNEIVDQFPKIFGQAMDYTKKMQAIKPWRKTIDAIEGAKLSHNDVNLMIDVLKGDTTAITEVLKRTGTDTLDLDTDADSNYVAKDYGRDDSALAINDIVDDISRDVEYATTHSILSKEWDDKSWATMAESPEMIKLLHEDVKSGMYQRLQPVADKLKVIDGGSRSDLDYYKEAAQQHFTQVAQYKAQAERTATKQAAEEAEKAATEAKQARMEKAKAQSAKRTATKQASTKRKAAAPTRNVANQGVTDYLDDSDEAFDDWYKRLQDDM